MTWPASPESSGIDPFAAPLTATPGAPACPPRSAGGRRVDQAQRRTPAQLLAPVQLAAEPPAGLGPPPAGFGPPTGPPPAGPMRAGPPSAGPHAGPTRAGQPSAGQPSAGPMRAGQPPTGAMRAGQPSAGQPPAGPPANRAPHPGPLGWETPVPTDRRRWWLVGAVVGVVAVAVLGACGALLIAQQRAAVLAGGQLVDADALSYRVPANWQVGPGGPATVVDGVALSGVATGPRYSCGGHGYHRATVGSMLLIAGDGGEASPDAAADYFGPVFAASFYGPDATVRSRSPAPLLVGAVNGSTSLVTVRTRGTASCPSRTGLLRMVALPTPRTGKHGEPAVLLMVLQHDDTGGPDESAPVDDRVMTAILDSVRVANDR